MHLTVLDVEQKFFAMLNKLRKFFTMTRKFNSENYYFKYRDLSEHKIHGTNEIFDSFVFSVFE